VGVGAEDSTNTNSLLNRNEQQSRALVVCCKKGNYLWKTDLPKIARIELMIFSRGELAKVSYHALKHEVLDRFTKSRELLHVVSIKSDLSRQHLQDVFNQWSWDASQVTAVTTAAREAGLVKSVDEEKYFWWNWVCNIRRKARERYREDRPTKLALALEGNTAD
jgi:hypothetical protein